MLTFGHPHHVKEQLRNNSKLPHTLCREHPLMYILEYAKDWFR